MYVRTFWKRVRALIKSKRKTQEMTAAACGIQYNTWRGWGSKDILPGVEDCIRIARYLEVSLDYMLCGKENNSQAKIAELQNLLEKANSKLTSLK